MPAKKFYKLFLANCFFLAFGTVAFGQGVYEAWVARYNGPGNNSDQAVAIATDDSGNVYVTGYSIGSGTTEDYATIKYAPNGDSTWVRRYNGPGNSQDYARALAVDDSGNVYVTGYSEGSGGSGDYATIKYAANGDTLWVRRYNGPGNSDDGARALALDDSGNVYVTGWSYGSGSGYDYATIKYSPNGDTGWVRRYNGPANYSDYANALAVDNSGNVYVTGESIGSLGYNNYATIKYAPNGDTLWVRRYNNGVENNWHEATALAVDTSGNVYVTGRSYGSGPNYDYATIKYAPNGNTLWVRRYSGPVNGNDVAHALEIDDNGNVYVTGSSWGGTTDDYATIKYAPDGDTAWVRRYNGPGNAGDSALALAVDDNGNVYVTGYSAGSGSSDDYATIKYAPNGDTTWVRRYEGPGNSADVANALALDDSGNVYVTGYSYGSGSSYDYATIKYSPCGAIPGDVNASGTITLGDVINLVNYYFDKDGPGCLGSDPGNCWTPNPFCRGDVNNSGTITLGDVIHLVNFYFDKSGPGCLGSDPGNCWTPISSGACCLAVP